MRERQRSRDGSRMRTREEEEEGNGARQHGQWRRRGTMSSGMRRRRLEGTAEELQVQRGGTRALAHGGRAAGVSSFRRLRLPGGETVGR